MVGGGRRPRGGRGGRARAARRGAADARGAAAALGPRWPQVRDPPRSPRPSPSARALVQVPPRGLWGESGAARWALTEAWLGAAPDREPSIDAARAALPRRLRSRHGGRRPHVVGIHRAAPVIERLRPQLRSFRDEQGRELLDVPDAPAPRPRDAGAAALPPRVRQPRPLPRRPRAALQRPGPGSAVPDRHVDRHRSTPTASTARGGSSPRRTGSRRWRSTASPRRARSRRTQDAIAAEGERLLRFVAPEATAQRVDFTGTTIGLTLAGSSRPACSAASTSSRP